MLSRIFADKQFPKRLVSLADAVAYHRPRALREFDQIYMMSGDMLAQVDLMKTYIESKRIVFLGDGDGMSMLFGLFAAKQEIEPPRSILVLDFDKRILANIQRFSESNGFKNSGIVLQTHPYNVIDPVPEEFIGTSDFFYINPPYGSRNFGKSTVAWLERCMELCTYACTGCLVVPYDDKERWSQLAMLQIQRFLVEKGFVIRDMVSHMHYYHLKDNPVLQSATIIVDRLERYDSSYARTYLPDNLITNLYGRPRQLPHFIEIDDSDYTKGTPDYDWKYGQQEY